MLVSEWRLLSGDTRPTRLPLCVQAAAHALRGHGLVGLYSGFGSSLLSEMLGTGLGFCAYEFGNQWWERAHGAKPTAAQKGVIGAASALVVMTATMPLELIQRRLQVRTHTLCSLCASGPCAPLPLYHASRLLPALSCLQQPGGCTPGMPCQPRTGLGALTQATSSASDPIHWPYANRRGGACPPCCVLPRRVLSLLWVRLWL